MENSKQNKKKFIVSLICIMVLILFSVGMVYAFFNYSRVGSRNNVLNTANLNLSFEDSEWIWLENAYPLRTEQALLLESNGSSEILEVDGGIAQFKVTGGHNSGSIHYYISLVKENLTTTTTSQNNRFTLDPSTKTGQLPDGAVSINLQSSTSNIFEETGLVDDIKYLLNPSNSFEAAANESYINTRGSTSIDKLPVEGTNERVVGSGIISGNVSTRYFELRMWINDTVMMNDDLRATCLSSTSSTDVTTYGVGYCNPSTTGLPDGIRYVYSSGEFAKYYYSNRIKIQTTDITNGVALEEAPIAESLASSVTVLDDSNFPNLFKYKSSNDDTGLLLRKPTANDPYPIYYYRGNVTNNYVKFGGFCWRIVRTTETGGTKIIFQGDIADDGTCFYQYVRPISSNTAFNDSINSAKYLGYKYDNSYPDRVSSPNSVDGGTTFIFGNSVNYNNGRYNLVDTVTVEKSDFSNAFKLDAPNSLTNYRYTCLGNLTSCDNVFYAINDFWGYYLNGARNFEEFFNGMLTDNDGSSYSTIANVLNNWYTQNLITYASYLEDTEFCSDTTYELTSSYSGANATNRIKFGAFDRVNDTHEPILTCPQESDRYTVSKKIGNGKLDYPIGLITIDEVMLAGWGNSYPSGTSNNSYIYMSGYQWTMSPARHEISETRVYALSSSGVEDRNVYAQFNVRPVVSLNKDVIFTSGTGTYDDPYVVGS